MPKVVEMRSKHQESWNFLYFTVDNAYFARGTLVTRSSSLSMSCLYLLGLVRLEVYFSGVEMKEMKEAEKNLFRYMENRDIELWISFFGLYLVCLRSEIT